MQDDEKNLYDALAEWRSAEYERIQERRSTEWRLTLAIWGGFGAISLAIVKSAKDLSQLPNLPWYFVLAGSVSLISLHAYFLKGIGERHHQNRLNAYPVIIKMANLLNINPPPPPNYKCLDWSRLVQLGISIILAFGLMVSRKFI